MHVHVFFIFIERWSSSSISLGIVGAKRLERGEFIMFPMIQAVVILTGLVRGALDPVAWERMQESGMKAVGDEQNLVLACVKAGIYGYVAGAPQVLAQGYLNLIDDGRKAVGWVQDKLSTSPMVETVAE
jgi:hypothetical protein